MSRLKIFSGTASQYLGKAVCKYLGMNLGKVTLSRFADSEINIQFEEDLRDCDVVILNSTQPPAENLLEVILMAEAARQSSASKVILVIPYLGYNRQDRKDRPRVPISARVIARMISQSGADRILLLDLHSEPTMGFFDHHIVVDHLYASIEAVPYLSELLKNDFVVASPDKGGGPRAEAYAKRLGQTEYVVCTKSRPESGLVNNDSIKVIGDVKDKDVLFIDDMIDTGGTICADAVAVQREGAKDVYAFATHGLFSQNALIRLQNAPLKQVVIMNTLHHNEALLKPYGDKIKVLSIHELLAKAILRLHQGQSLSPLILQ